MDFDDDNLKLALISCLFEQGELFENAEKLRFDLLSSRSFQSLDFDGIVSEVKSYFLNYPTDQFEFIEVFNPTLSSRTYNLMVKEWSGEDDIFDIHSFEGIQALKNLKIFKPFGLLDYDVDLSSLLECKSLNILYREFIPDTPSSAKVINKLKKKGVNII